MSNHIEDADKALDVLFRPAGVSVEKATAQAQLAQAHALIAIAEQLRIANRIALDAVNSQNSGLFDYADTQFGRTIKGIKPDIAEALDMGGESDD